jgi:hypothetical protein
MDKNILKLLNLLTSLLCLIIVLYYWNKFYSFSFNEAQKGSQGEQGQYGEIGNRGPIGINGPNIDININGQKTIIPDKGVIGDIGLQGSKGKQGNQGPVGPEGDKGNTGNQGIQGIVGLPGPRGPQGANGKTIDVPIYVLTKYNDCIWTGDMECPDNMVVSGLKTQPYLQKQCCPLRLYVVKF